MTTCVFEVPATSANLGPGFDAIGAALTLRLRASMRPHLEGMQICFDATEHAPTHGGFKEEIIRGIRALVDELPAIELRINNQIPLGRGLGSSAAAIVLGLLVADAAFELHTPLEKLIQLAGRVEGHPDNTTPALIGGIVISVPAEREAPAYLRIAPPKGVGVIAAIPDFSLSTEMSRSLLPETYSKPDCTFNVQRAALLAASFATGDFTYLRTAMQDRLHQPYRAALVPGLEGVLALEQHGLLGVALSGSGPTIIAFAEEKYVSSVGKKIERTLNTYDVACKILTLDFSATGASCLERKPSVSKQ